MLIVRRHGIVLTSQHSVSVREVLSLPEETTTSDILRCGTVRVRPRETGRKIDLPR